MGLTAIGPGQAMIGYWGTGQPETIQAQWQHLSTQNVPLPPKWLHSSPIDDNQTLWTVAWSPISLASDVSTTEVVKLGLSIAGFSQPSGWDATVTLSRDRLMLSRDGFGRVPLYWLERDQGIWFASRWQWLAPLSRDRAAISLSAAYGYACFSYVPTLEMPLADIAQLPAGTEQTWTASPQELIGSTVTTSTWQEATDQIKDEAIAIAQLQTLLQAEIQTQIADLPDAPVGVFLSGGLDSSIVAALLVQAGLKVKAYTLNFEQAGLPELPYAAQVAEFLNIPLVTVTVSPRQMRQALVPTAQALDLPFGDGVTVPFYLLAKAASQEVSIVFNGEGGDQLFAGWTNKPLIAAGVYQATHPQAAAFTQQYLQTFHRLWGYEQQIFQPEVWEQIRSLQPADWLQTALDPAQCPALLHRLRRATLMLKGAQNIQPRATAIGQAHGLQVRSPFCSLPLAQWAFQVTSELHLQGACEKYILKRAVADWLPPEVVWRSKRGMGVPLTTWCLGELWHDLGTWLNPAQLQQEGIWHPHIAHRIVTGQLGTIRGRRIGECLWLLLMWQVWRQASGMRRPTALSLHHPFWLPASMGRGYCRLAQGRL